MLATTNLMGARSCGAGRGRALAVADSVCLCGPRLGEAGQTATRANLGRDDRSDASGGTARPDDRPRPDPAQGGARDRHGDDHDHHRRWRVMTVVDSKGFPSIGLGLWWAVQTVTTVGYGDVVPTTVAGQIIAAIVMLLGIGFVTVITASITGAFVARSRKDDQEVIQRLERIEAALHQLSSGSKSP